MAKIHQDQVVLITGATSGIGAACVDLFLAEGARIVATGRDARKLSTIEAADARYRNRVLSRAGDLTRIDFRKRLIADAIEAFGSLDVLVNAAGIIASGTIETTSLEGFDEMMEVNVRSVFHLIQLAVPHLVKQKGNVVNISSVTGVRAFPGILAYCVSKAALDQLTRAVALELAEKGVRVNAVNPGVVETNLHKRSGMTESQYKRFLKHSETTHPLGRVGQPREIADLISFLASRRAGWITGETISIDGGRHQTCAR